MTLSTIRRFTAQDRDRLGTAAQRFAQRHHIPLDTDESTSPEWALETSIECMDPLEQRTHLLKLWQACKCRALDLPVSASITVAYGYVGHSVG